MLDKDPVTGVPFITALWATFIAVLGGFVAFLQNWSKTKLNRTLTQTLFLLFVQSVVSAFAGFVAFYLTSAWIEDDRLVIAVVAICGHMGGSVIERIEDNVDTFFKFKK